MRNDPWQSGDWRKQIAATLEAYARNVIRAGRSEGFGDPDIGHYVESIVTDARVALLADRAVPEPAADAVERAAKALATAAEFGVACDRREAIQRSRENLRHVRALATAKGVGR